MNSSGASKASGILASVVGSTVLFLLVVIAVVLYHSAWIPARRVARLTATLKSIGAADSEMAYGRIDELSLDHRSSIRDLAFLHDMPDLRRLSLQFTVISDADLSDLKATPYLEELDLGMAFHDTGLDLVEYFHGEWMGMDLRTAAGMRQLRQDIARRSVALRNADITSAGMQHVGRLQSLQRLSLHNTAVDNEGLRHLARLPNLKELDLRLTHVNDEGIQCLRSFPSLEKLDIGNNRYISDDCLGDVSKISTLTELRPPFSLSDESLMHLHKAHGLRVLDLRDCQFSTEALKELRAALPRCEILLDGGS